MTTENRQIDPANPGPTISVIAVLHTLVTIGEGIAHVLEAHEVDDKGTGDLAFMLLKIANLSDQFNALLDADGDIQAAEAKIAEQAAAEVPDDLWTALGQVMSEDEIKAIQDAVGGASGE